MSSYSINRIKLAYTQQFIFTEKDVGLTSKLTTSLIPKGAVNIKLFLSSNFIPKAVAVSGNFDIT